MNAKEKRDIMRYAELARFQHDREEDLTFKERNKNEPNKNVPVRVKDIPGVQKKLIERKQYDLLNDLTDMVWAVWQLIEKGEVK